MFREMNEMHLVQVETLADSGRARWHTTSDAKLEMNDGVQLEALTLCPFQHDWPIQSLTGARCDGARRRV
jgi:hypothetical protein